MPTDKTFDFGNDNLESNPSINTSDFQNEHISSAASQKNQSTESSAGKGDPGTAWTQNVVITDQNSPIVILFGPSMCGKTMTLVRLTRFLSGRSYSFVPDKSFKDSTDDEYKELCERFNSAVGSDNAALGTRYIDFMLLRVNGNRGKTFCQFVESPGEFLFNPENANAPFPAYFETIRGSRNRKIWVFFLEPTLSNEEKRAYVRRISQNIVFGEEDRFVFLVNKIDMPETNHLMTTMETVDQTGLRNYVDQLFVGLTDCDRFVVHRMFSDKERFKIVGFQTGTYREGKDRDGKPYKTFQAGHDSHPKRLWDAISGAVNGEW
jgi:hypothetical protein